ncbi:adenylate cyclase [Coprinopsis marcescibilis]|uniref:Adenylate cyclase n=1 Tax=Coprinopsis marcescibilis TaxID=230819 RepID=A0A5C3KNX5_COPMA|nr:adenylate cyclase [Coprinopsis marcescibilis]
MDRRDSGISLRLSEDAVDDYGRARMEYIAPGPTNDNSTIAPWLDEPPTPPPKSPLRTFNFTPKPSISSLASARSGSYSNGSRYGRHSESQSTLAIPPDNRRSVDGDGESSRGNVYSGSSSQSVELRKSKSSFNLGLISQKLRSRSSKANLGPSDGSASEATQHPSLKPPAPPMPSSSFLQLGQRNGSFLSISKSTPKPSKPKEEKKKKAPQPVQPPPREATPPPVVQQPLVEMNADDMIGILNPNVHHTNGFSSPSDGGGSDYGTMIYPVNPVTSTFSNPDPFSKAPSISRRNNYPGAHETRRPSQISPKTAVPPNGFPNARRSAGSISSAVVNGTEDSPIWKPPDSWAVEPQSPDGDNMEDTAYSSSDESTHSPGTVVAKMASTAVPHDRHPLPPIDPSSSQNRSLKSRKARFSHIDKVACKIKIYRSNGRMHVITFPLSCTVADLSKELTAKVLRDHERSEQHKLYLDENGRERLLGPNEKPAHIVIRRLKLAGYETVDGLENMGNDDLPFLFKFCYKSQFLGPPEDDLNFDNFDFIDLTGRSLRTIPVVLHQNADSIVSLKLSRNPMLEIPLDFIQSCSTLRELRLSNMAMQKVPQSVRHSTTLHRLDLSSNRIKELEDAFLDHIPNLLCLFVQNNKLSALPWHFGRLRNLTTLNISNNRFKCFPKVVFQMENLLDLDISFNAITDLPEEIGQLKHLERLILVGNQIARFPTEVSRLVNLHLLDCRRNTVSDLTVVLMLPKLRTVEAEHNSIHALDLSIGPNLTTLAVSHNDITQLSLIPGPLGRSPYSLTSLDLSYAKLSSLDDLALGTLTSLRTLRLDHNAFRAIPDTLGDLSWLETLSCSDNHLDKLPNSIGRLQKLETLDAHNNQLTELPSTLWNCASLTRINVTSNFLRFWHDPPAPNDTIFDDPMAPHLGRKGSTASTTSLFGLPPLVHSLEKLYLGENRLTDDTIHPLMIFKELRVLNLSFNEIQELPSIFFRNMVHLEELYLSGNKLTSIPTEDLHRMKRLSTLYLNGNRLQTLPQELGKVKDLSILDVGSNMLKYNINNWEFDWNWNFNKRLKYLNLSGNNRLQIKGESSRTSTSNHGGRKSHEIGRQSLAGFKELTSLRVLGLMDVTIGITTTGADADIPDNNDLRRVRTSPSTINGMAYGIADSLGRNDLLNMLDLVYEFTNEPGKAVFAMFGRSHPPKGLQPHTSPTRLSRYLQDKFKDVFTHQLSKGGPVPDALRRTFLKLNQNLHKHLSDLRRKNSQASGTCNTNVPLTNDPALMRAGASSIVVYFMGKTVYVGNVGDALAVVSRSGTARSLSRRHDPYDRDETNHIRSAEGWIAPSGLINEEVEVSRSFGHFHLVPVVHARPDIVTWELTEQDEFIIVANRGLWEYVPYQTAVDIVRADRDETDPMIAAQKLRDFAISYGADGSTMIMVIMVRDLFKEEAARRERQGTWDSNILIPAKKTRPKREDFPIKENRYMQAEVDPPTGHIALAFTDIVNSTHLWEVNPGMPMAMRLHNSLLRRQLRICGGYEVKTEGDAFMVSFPTALAAVWWCLTVQSELMKESWPLEILECEDGKGAVDDDGLLVARGLSVRMGIHCGSPVCETDVITNRMDYFGSVVNRSARIQSSAAGGQIMISVDILREIGARVFETEPETEYSRIQTQQAVDAIKNMGVVVVPVGEVKLKGFEFTEVLSAIYPKGLEGRHSLKVSSSTNSASRVQFSVPQTKDLGLLCLRLEALSGGRLFRTPHARKGSIQSLSNTLENEEEKEQESPLVLMADPDILLPPINEQSTDTDLTLVLDSLATRIENAASALAQRLCSPTLDKSDVLSALLECQLDQRTLEYLSSVLRNI